MIETVRIQTQPMRHQCAAVDKVSRLRVGALFMDMGTGKTLTALLLIAARRERISRVLWFCPVALKESTRLEILKHYPDARIHVFDDKTSLRQNHKGLRKYLPEADIYLIGIESMSSSRRVIFAAAALADSRAFVIVDESSYIKGHMASRTKWITRIGERVRYRLLLTGTPISQGVVDLYAQMRFLSPEILGYKSFYSFARNHLEYSAKCPGLIVASHNQPYIAAKMAPYVYQVTKDECLDLPPKICTERQFSMTPEQRALYEQAKDELLLAVTDRDIESRDIFRLFTALQQICCGFWHRIEHCGRGKNYRRHEETFEVEHSRLDLLRTVLGRISRDEKVIVWAKYRHCTAQIAAMVRNDFDEEPALFTGKENEKTRTQNLARWRRSDGPRFFIATPSCGGHDLTLNEACHSVFYTDSFKYAERLQAEDRCHRIGQERKTVYLSLVCRNSIDERIQQALATKGNAVTQFRDEIERIRDKKTVLQAIKAL